MAKKFWKENWRKRSVLGVAALLSCSLALGVFSACTTPNDNDDDDDDTTVSRTDTQLIKNGDFEFYSEMDKETAEKRTIINSPNNWSISSDTPSSDTKSGIINVTQAEWDGYTQSTYRLVPPDDAKDEDKPSNDVAIASAMAHWEEASVYDRLQFLDVYSKALNELSSSSDEKKFFEDYNYSVDFEDVENLRKELGATVKTHSEAEENTSLLMIHNSRKDSDIRGTGQRYTSSTTITLKPGTAARVSVWVKTSALYHYDDVAITRNSAWGGAYIGVTNTVGSTTLPQMQIKNIRSPYEGESDYNVNNGWSQYTVFVRGSTFAESSFRIVLGLGESSSSDRLNAVDGYALFDDLECTILSDTDYTELTGSAGIETGKDSNNYCTLDSSSEEKIFDTVKNGNRYSYALDLYAGFEKINFITGEDGNVKAGVTTETSGSKEYSSKVEDNRNDSSVPLDRRSIAGLYNYGQLAARTNPETLDYNGYFANIFENDFKDAFPFDGADKNEQQVILLMSTNGAAYTANVSNSAFTVKKDSYKLVSFFVKTSKIRSGSGASAVLVDEAGNESSIAAFDSTTIAQTDIDNNSQDSEYNKENIYNGWTQCFFFVENSTDKAQTFTLKLRFGTATVASATLSDYDDGYAAFAKFEAQTLTSTQYGYVSTNSRAVKVALSDTVKPSSAFDSAARTSDIKTGLATPVQFTGVVSTNFRVDPDGDENNDIPDGVYAGLLNAQYAETYMNSEEEWVTELTKHANGATAPNEWWNNIFSDSSLTGMVSNQPLVIVNAKGTEETSYGYLLKDSITVSADSYQKISLRVKLSQGAKAYIYLNDTSDIKNGYGNTLTPSMNKVTYWYDDEGNICRIDPSDSEFKKKNDVLFYLESNGLYTKANDTSGTYYANLHNYDEDEQGNKVTSTDKTIAYFYNRSESKYYAYYDEETDKYSQEVVNLPTTDDNGNSILRYEAPANLSAYNSVIVIEGTQETAGMWIDASFFLHTGNEQKTFRVEVWAGSRDNKTKIPANSYFFFDSYSSSDASSNYQTMLDEKIANLKNDYNARNNLTPGMEGYLGDDDNLPTDYALYSTFTFYDAPWYLRYDETTDEDNAGNPYAGYKQSDNAEKLIYLRYNNSAGQIYDKELYANNCFIDYSAYNVTVEESSSSDGDHDNDHDADTTNNPENNIWLILSSVLLVVALAFAIAVVIGRRVYKKLKSAGKLPSQKAPKKKKKKAPVEVVKDEQPAPEEEPKNPNDPYNE